MPRRHQQGGELLRAIIDPQGGMTCTIDVAALGADPALFGLALADIARHGAAAWSQALEGVDVDHALDRILEMFEQEMARPTDRPRQIQPAGRN